MPLYEYVCTTCRNRFEKLRPMESAGEDANCPDCGSPAPRALSVFASFSRSEGGEMQAFGGGGCAGCGGGSCASCAAV